MPYHNFIHKEAEGIDLQHNIAAEPLLFMVILLFFLIYGPPSLKRKQKDHKELRFRS